MEENSGDLIRQFKSKVEEAINLLPQIPELYRKDVWTYWQIISVVVKAAVGGRGSFIGKQLAASQRRPRGRPRLLAQQHSLLLENVGKNQVDSKAIGSSVKKPRRKGKQDEKILSHRKHTVDHLSPGQQRDGAKMVDSSDTSSTGSTGDTTVTDGQSSSVADIGNHIISVSGSTKEPLSSVINNIHTGCKNNTSALIQELASFVQTEGNSCLARNKCLSQHQQTGVELLQMLGSSEIDPPDKPESNCRKEQDSVVIQMSCDTAEHPSDKMKALHCDTPPRSETMVISHSEIVQKRYVTDNTSSEIQISVPNEMGVSATSVLKSNQDTQMESYEGQTSVMDSAAHQDSHASVSVSGTTEKSSQENGFVQSVHEHGNIVAEVAQPFKPPVASTSQTVDSVKPHSSQGQYCTRLASDTTNISIDVAPSSCSMNTKLSSSPCGPVTTSIKRKRGRPRKITEDKHLQNLFIPGSLTSCLASHQSEKPQQISAISKNSGEKCREVGFCLPPLSKKRNNFISSAQASDQIQKSKKTSHEEPTVSTSAVAVRRSERRTVPNRDEIFCYFAPSHHNKLEEEDTEVKEEEAEKEGEEEENVGREEEAEKEEEEKEKVRVVKVENREMKVKTEEEKQKEKMCPKCHVVLKSASSLTAHMRIHTGERPFSCPVCHKSFTTKGNCERHEVTHVGLKAFTCLQCNKKFTEKKSLKIHMRAHTGERPYVCQVCGMGFFQSGTLKTHMDRHTGHKGHLCDLCGKAFRQSCQLRVHMRRHKSHTPFQCQHCSRNFYTKSDMERHELRHTGERPFSCDQCSKTFTRMQYLREHQNSHLGRRPYRCVVCGMSFHTFAACHRHVNKHKLPVATDPVMDTHQSVQQIHVEVAPDTPTHQVMEQVQVILDQQHLTDYHTTNVQTFIIPDSQSLSQAMGVSTTTSAITGPNPQSSAHAILSNLGLEVEETSEIYHVTLVDPAQSITIPIDQRVASNSVSTVADFSAINLLANATTQLSAPP